MGAFQLNSVTYDPFGVVINGLVFVYNATYLISGMELVTEGFLYNRADMWIDAENCQSVTYTLVDSF